MANVKISELPNATSLSNGDSFPVVQGGVTKQAARSVLFASPTFTGTTTAAILTATGDVTFDGGAFVFNESGADKDARFEGDTDANLLFLDASTDRVGIGTATPAHRLDVTGAQNSVQARFGAVANRGLEISTAIIAGTNDAGSVLNAKGATSGTLIFQTDSVERMRLDSSGNLGIGATSVTPVFGTTVRAFNSSSGATFEVGGSSVNARLYAAQGASLGGVGTSSSHPFIFVTNDVERMRLDASGNLIYRVNGTAPSLSTNSTMSFELTSNTSLKIVVRGTDGTTRSVSLTLA